ncbi:hypothetical protein TRICI_003149 [Trichomonascus ciferrii]|uniref:Uncharacterized protein n=1 Tax=Trichomonascus ciferrii TaxID=44093 RepID=A0A642V3V0_9ASCO|nr:hypothetical protein TRICI_003149 [Trichomonascus ciferrii]
MWLIRRGRPRKNPSDRVEKPATGSSGEQKVDKAGLIADISNSTGGDAQTPNPDVKPKRGRGRPPKYKKEAPAEQEKEKKTPSTTEQDKAPSTQEDSTPSTKPKTATSDEDSNESGSPPPESLSVVVEKSNGDTTSDAKQE